MSPTTLRPRGSISPLACDTCIGYAIAKAKAVDNFVSSTTSDSRRKPYLFSLMDGGDYLCPRCGKRTTGTLGLT